MAHAKANTPKLDGLLREVKASRLPAPRVRREIREAAGVSLREAARALGVTAMSLGRWERGEVQPRRGNAAKYRRLLDALEKVA